MKTCALLLLLTTLGTPGLTSALPQDAGGVAVVKFGWHKERIGPRPSMAPMASAEALREQSMNEARLSAARNSPSRGDAGKIETAMNRQEEAAAKARQTAPPRDGYRYKVTVRNDGEKVIKSVDWDYLFLDSNTGAEMARHQFTSDDTIKPGKGKEISVLYLAPPVKTVSAAALDKKNPTPFKEQVLLMRIQYSDGSVWQRP